VSAKQAVAGQCLQNVLRASGGKPPQQDVLMAIFMDNYAPARTPAGDPFAVALHTPSVAIPLKGKGSLRQRLAVDMFSLIGKMPSQEAQSTVTGMIEGLCAQSRLTGKQAVRIAMKGTERFLDLGGPDGSAVVIGPGGWQVTTRALPVLFRRTALTRPLPVPAERGNLDGARHLFNIAEGGEWTAFVAARICSVLFPAATHPAEIFTSDTSGSLKTATVKHTKAWIDPGVFLPVPKDSRSWAATAGNTYVSAIDNVSFIADWWSDLLCKGASGDAWADRALYTDNEAMTAEFSVVPLLDGIGMVSVRADLADRAIRYHLSRPQYYLGDDEAESAWERSHPEALAWLLDWSAAVARALLVTERPRTSRLSNYEHVLVCLDRLWLTGGAGHRWWLESQRGVAQDTVAGDALSSAIATRVASPVDLTTGQLQVMLSGALPNEGREPWSVPKIGRRMPRAADALSKLGWHLQRGEPGHAGSRSWAIYPPGSWARQEDGTVRPHLAIAAPPPPQSGEQPYEPGRFRAFGEKD
jgi:hypothetical protein